MNPIRRLFQSSAAREERAVQEAIRQIKASQPFVEILQGIPAIEGYGEQTDLPYPHPDPVIRRKGFKHYDIMELEDDAVGTGLGYLYLAVVAPGLSFKAAGDGTEEIEKKALAFQQDQWDQMVGTPSQRVLNMLTGCGDGCSVSELVYGEQITEGDWLGKQMVTRMAAKSMRYIEFKTNSYGRVAEEGVWQRNYSAGSATWNKADLLDVIYFCFKPKADSPYGSPMKCAMEPWYVWKKQIRQYWGLFCQRYGMPMPIGTVDDGALAAKKTDFLNKLMGIVQNYAIVRERSDEIEFKEVSHRPTETFENAIRFANRSIMRAAYLPALVLEHDATGSFAASKEHGGNQFLWVLKFLGPYAAHTLQEQLVRRTHPHNFGVEAMAACPRVEMNSYESEDLQIVANTWKILQDMGLTFSLKAVRDRFDIPAPADGEEVLGAKPEPPASGYLMPGEDEEAAQQVVEVAHDLARGKLRMGQQYWTVGGDGGSERGGNGKCLHAARPPRRPMTPLETHHDFARDNRRADEALEKARADFGVTFEAVTNDLAELAGKESGVRPPR